MTPVLKSWFLAAAPLPPPFCRLSWLEVVRSNVQVNERSESPYEPSLVPSHTTGRALRVSVWLLVFITSCVTVGTVLLFVVQPDIEGLISRTISGRHMPDAFNRLNDVLPIYFIFLTVSFVLSLRITITRRYSLLIPLFAGPAMCAVIWCLSETFDDPNWFQLFAGQTIGMLVSCFLTSVVAGLSRKRQNNRLHANTA